MKKNVVVALLLMVAVTSFSQPAPVVKKDYLKKSSNQKFTAWVLLGGGAAVVGITALSNLGVDFTGPKKEFPVVPVGIGAACMVGSIPFFIASGKNKRKAMSMSFKNERIPSRLLSGQKSSFVNRAVPSLSLKISL